MFKTKNFGTWRDVSVINGTLGLGFDSQNPHGGSLPPMTLATEAPIPFSHTVGTCIHNVQAHPPAYTHIPYKKVNTYKKEIKEPQRIVIIGLRSGDGMR